jgi:prepilin-type N-terminal cleavage/methylation domain-containing protein
MLARIRQSAKTENDKGFTLIELLVVMIIIGILAAIAIPVFLNQRQKAQDSATKADVTTLGKEIATYFVDNSAAPAVAITGTAPNLRYTLTPSGGTAQDIGRVSANVGSLVANFNATTPTTKWCVQLTNAQGSTPTWHYSGTNGLQSGACVGGGTATSDW